MLRDGLKMTLRNRLVNSLFHYPANMTFFTTPELLEIGDIPFPSPNQKPTRAEALEYYRKVAEHYKLVIRQYEGVREVTGRDCDFQAIGDGIRVVIERITQSQNLAIARGQLFENASQLREQLILLEFLNGHRLF